jgi:DNA-directed RNA polymerase delta subunit
MSTEATWSLFTRAVVHVARFVSKKFLQDSVMHNIWQYLDLSQADMTERIQHLLQSLNIASGNIYFIYIESQIDCQVCI